MSAILNLKFRSLTAYYRLQARLRCWSVTLPYKLKHWAFQWKMDEEGDVAFVLFGVFTFVKYKEHTVLRLDGAKMKDAPKYLMDERDCDCNKS